LGAHLTGVLGGLWLRSKATTERGEQPDKTYGRRRKIISTIMIYLGVLAWAPYFYLKYGLGETVDLTPFLIAHLTGVLGGAILRASVEAQRIYQRGLSGRGRAAKNDLPG